MRIYEEYPQLLDPTFVEDYTFRDCWTRKNPSAPVGELDAAVAIIRTGGVLKDVATVLGRSRTVTASAVENNPHLSELLNEIAEEFLDEVEKIHRNAALAGDGTAIRYILSTLGKGRGYVTRTDHNVKQATSVTIDKDDAEL